MSDKSDEKSQDVHKRFTSYLNRSIQNEKADYIKRKIKREQLEDIIDFSSEQNNYIQGNLFNDDIIVIVEQRLGLHNIMNYIENQKLAAALSSLSGIERNVLVLRAFKKESFINIAKTIQMNKEQTRNIYYCAIRKIRKRMGKLNEF